MIGVFIADDHPVVRQGIRQIVAATDDIAVVDEATTGHETLLPGTPMSLQGEEQRLKDGRGHLGNSCDRMPNLKSAKLGLAWLDFFAAYFLSSSED